VESGVEHRAHQHREHPTPELVGDEESDDAGIIGFRLEGPAVLELAERTLQIFDHDFQVRTIERHPACKSLADKLKRHCHVGDDDLAAVRLRRSLADFQRLAQRHEFRIALDVGDEIEHFLRAVMHAALV